MRWIELSVVTSEAASEAVSEFLMQKGANGVEMVDPGAFKQVLEANRYLDYVDEGFIETYGTDVVIRAYFSEDRNAAEMAAEVNRYIAGISEFMETKPALVSWLVRDDSEWKDNWKQYYKTFVFTEKIIVKPSWEEYTPKAGEILISMDPGMAFGTGTHETTKMCALMGEKHVRPNDRVLDLGCGTAILAISAVKLGASSALAVDIDDAAVKSARENVINNQADQQVEVRCGILSDVQPEPFNLVFINIIADVILSIIPDLKPYLDQSSKVILSGIIKGRRDDVLSACEANGFKLIDEMGMGEWVALVVHA